MSTSIYDSLTGLPTTDLFLHNLELALALSARTAEKAVVLLIENPTSFSDDDLLETANRLKSSVRATDTVALLSDSVFALILTKLKDSDNAVRVADNVIQKTKEPYVRAGVTLRHHPLIGMSVFPDDATSSQELLVCAKKALTGAKSNRIGHYSFYNEDMNARVHRRRTLLNDLTICWRNGDFELHESPPAAGSTPGASSTLELLWNHQTEGYLVEDQFMPLAYEAGVYTEMLSFLCKSAMARVEQCPSNKWSFRAISVMDNQVVAHALPTSELESFKHKSQVGIVVAEAAIALETEKVTRTMDTWKTTGGFISIRDFGTYPVPAKFWSSSPVSELRKLSIGDDSSETRMALFLGWSVALDRIRSF